MSWTERGSALAITVVGNPGLDTLVMVGEDEPDLHADGHFVRNIDTVGHAAAFSARGLARLGHRVRILGSVGDDPIGRMVTAVLADDGVDTSLLFQDTAGTARSVNFVFPDGRRSFFYDGGSHMTLIPPEDCVAEALRGADLIVSSLPNWARDVLPRARAAGIPVAVDLQDVRSADDAYRADFVANADHLFASAAHLPDPADAARRWFAAGPAAQVVFGVGARGALLAHRDDGTAPRLAPPPPGDLPVVDTTGCGDSLAVGFLDGLLALGLDPHVALHRGQALARIVASQPGNDARFDRAVLDAAASVTTGTSST
jgi:sugar/nucleoside kinase (ribokinase family)